MLESEIEEELMEGYRELKALPDNLHWFCPRRSDASDIDYRHPDEAEVDISVETKKKHIEEGKHRYDIAYGLSLSLGMGSNKIEECLVFFHDGLKRWLSSCDSCIHAWHLGRKPYLKKLRENYSDEVIDEISNRLDIVDIQRINKGLESAAKLLATLDPAQRTQQYLAQGDQAALLALFESLCCVEFYKSDDRLSIHFNYIFSQIQSRKIIRLQWQTPAMAKFLFQKDTIRLRFATNAWQRMPGMLDTECFDWVVHDVLSEAIWKVSQPQNVDKGDIQRFWNGFLMILEKMDEDLITHSLRAMEVQPDIYHLGLQHLQQDSEDIVQHIIEAYCQLLEKAPKVFWSAMGTISPATVAEQIFQSPGYEKVLGNDQNLQNFETNPAISWVPGLIKSLDSIQQHDACRSLLYNLFERLQAQHFSEDSRISCCRAGLTALRETLGTFINPTYKINPSTSLIVIDDIMGLVNKYKGTIVGCADMDDPEGRHLELKKLGMLVIQDALTLDCKAMSAEFFALQNGTRIQRGLRTHSQSVWQAILDIFRPGNLDLAKSILNATMLLTGLDEILPENKNNLDLMPKDHIQFNKDFNQLMDNISRVFERLSDFKSSDLLQLCQDPLTARPLFAALVSANQGVYEATVEVIKSTAGQLGKQDAFSALLEKSFIPMLNSLTFAVIKVTKAKAFSPSPYAIKVGREVLQALSGNTGTKVLRSGSFTSTEQGTIMSWWTNQWRALDMIFLTTESWAPRVSQPTTYMQDFCRDGMEFAEGLFDEHTIFASALKDSTDSNVLVKSKSDKAHLKKVLEVVCLNVNGLTGLLRLRDAYLISVITSLLAKLLRCLAECDLEIDERASEFIKNACKRENQQDFKRTNLTSQQKAELQRALDGHQGVKIVEAPPPTAFKKQSTIDSWSNSADGMKHEPTLPRRGQTLNLTSSSDRTRGSLEQMRSNFKSRTISPPTQPNMNAFKENRRKAEEERKRKTAEFVAVTRAKAGGVQGEGSGLKDIGGVVGKDHAPVRNEIMVDSDDSDSDDNDDEDETGALIKTTKQRSKIVSEYEESRRLALKQAQQGPIRKKKIVRSAKDLRARVEPNMDKLYIEILNWDIFHPGDAPPSNIQCEKIADKFLDLDRYKRTFSPLLTSEVWRSLVTAKEENNFKPIMVTVLNQMMVDKFIEVSTKMPLTLNRDLKVSERDIVLLSKSTDPLQNQQEPHCLARVERTTRKKDGIEVTFRVSSGISPVLRQSLGLNSKIWAVKIADMTTTQREYAALSSLEYYDLCNEVLEAKPSPLQKYSDDKIISISSKYNLNRGQAQAILSANDNDGFTLIQGPPGSGKTKTIIAMVGSLLTQSLQQQNGQIRAPTIQGKSTTPAPTSPKKKLLICAPSNAAVDELVVRLKEGILPLNGPRQNINVIRLGRSDAVNAAVKDVTLDELVSRKLEGDHGEKNNLVQARDKLHEDARKIKEQLNVIRPQVEEARKNGEKSLELKLRRTFDELKRTQARIGSKIDEDKEGGNTVSRQNEINRRRFQQEILDGAHVLCATLSGSGHDMFRNLNVEFETVIIDEAAQCIELSALIPLKYGCSKCILVGDPEQLPPTVLSRSAKSFGYEQSLFIRMQHNHPEDIHLLDTQYRMHPDISSFPSKQFYNGRLVDGEDMANLRKQPWHASTILGPYRFFDVKGVQTKEAKGHSFINVPELNAAVQLYQRLKADYRDINFTGKIGIIATYKAQLNALKDRFTSRFGEAIFEEIEFNTTDAFQGREREIIIFSCVRATPTGGIGFLSDIRRMNVGLTRAKSSLWVLGDSRALQQGEFWNKLIEDSKVRDKYTNGDVMALLSRPTSRINLPVQTATSQHNTNTNDSNHQSSTTALNLPKRETNFAPQKVEDEDIEMTDVPDSRKSSTSNSNTMASRPQESQVKQESRKSSLDAGKDISDKKNSHGKRPGDDIKDADAPPKKTPPPKNDKVTDLDAALRAQQASKPPPTGARPPRPPGAPPLRRKAPVDPFIQRKRR